MILPKIIGKLTYVITWPGIRLWLYKSNRVYLMLIVKDEILVTKNWLGLHKKWRLPGGGLKTNEPHKAGLIRECQEELGIDISSFNLSVNKTKNIKTKAGYKYTVFTAKLPSKPNISSNQHEITEFAWINYQDLANYPCSEELKYALDNCF